MIRIVLSIMRHSALCPRFVRNHDFYCLLCRSNDSQIALVTFKEPQALDTALLLSVREFLRLLRCLSSIYLDLSSFALC